MIHIVTDSTADLSAEDAIALGVRVVPLTVRFGQEEFRDGIDISAAEFYRRLTDADIHPTTSQPAPEQFAQVYRELLSNPDDTVVSIHISSKLSGTLQSATLAAQEFPGRVHAVDTLSVSAATQLLVRAAASDVAAGKTVTEVVAGVEERRARCELFALIDTMIYLQRGGRIGRAQSLVGGILNIKPLIKTVDGVVSPAGRARGHKQGMERMLALVKESGELEAVSTFHAGAPQLIEEVLPQLQKAYPNLKVIAGEIGPVVGTYAGPGSIGVALIRAG